MEEQIDKIFDDVGDIKQGIVKLTTTQNFIEEKQKGHDDLFEKHNERIGVLEKSVTKIVVYVGIGIAAITFAGQRLFNWVFGGS